MKNIRYFDHAATTGVKEEVLKEMLPYFNIEYGNPSSIYGIGRSVKRAIEGAREKVAKAINAKPNEIYFTGCGSESDNLAIKGIAYAFKKKGNHIITSRIEHHAVLNSCKSLERDGFKVTYLNVDKDGLINLQELKETITDKTILITIMTANNEIGTIEPIEEIGKIAKKNNVYFHTDSVQAIGNIKIDVQKMNIDSLSMSAHKFYGPKGVGALYVKEGVPFIKLQDGGHQEKNKRAGTENTAGMIGLGKAIELAYKNSIDMLALDEKGKIGYTLKTMSAALWAYNHSTDFYTGLRTIIEQGGDADTNGALTGALLGMKFGFSSLPVHLSNNLIGKDTLINKANSFISIL